MNLALTLGADQERRFRAAWADTEITISQIGARFGMSEGSAQREALRLGLGPKESRSQSWTPERTDLLRKLWTSGMSANQIGKTLGGVSRNSVIGKAHRLGLTGSGVHATRAKPSAPSLPKRALGIEPPKTKLHPAGNRVYLVSDDAPLPVLGGALPGSSPRPWLERPNGTCTWIVEGDGADSRACCEPVFARGWCVEHHRRGTTTPRPGVPRTGNELARALRRYVA